MSPKELVPSFPACARVGQPGMSPVYQEEVENQEKETEERRRSAPLNKQGSAEVTAMTLSWRRARAPCRHLLEIPPRRQAGILRHVLTAGAGQAGAQAVTTHPLGPPGTCSKELPSTAEELTLHSSEHRVPRSSAPACSPPGGLSSCPPPRGMATAFLI